MLSRRYFSRRGEDHFIERKEQGIQVYGEGTTNRIL